MFAEDAKATDLSFGRQFMDNADNGGAMSKHVALLAGEHSDFEISIHNGEIIRQFQSAQQGMIGFDPGIDDGDLDAGATAIANKVAGLIEGWQRTDSHSLVQPTARLRRWNSISCASNAVALCTAAKCSGRKP